MAPADFSIIVASDRARRVSCHELRRQVFIEQGAAAGPSRRLQRH